MKPLRAEKSGRKSKFLSNQKEKKMTIILQILISLIIVLGGISSFLLLQIDGFLVKNEGKTISFGANNSLYSPIKNVKSLPFYANKMRDFCKYIRNIHIHIPQKLIVNKT
jgi:hypothetical protein